jgi:hypothetical protein
VEGATRVFVEKFLPHGERRIEQLRLPFRDEGHVLDVIYRIVRPLGLDLSASSPSVSGRLPNGRAVYASVPPASVHGPMLSILCQELTRLDVLPDWHVGYRSGDQPPVFKNEGASGQEDFCLSVTVPTESYSVNLSQRLSARSFRGKTVRFAGATKVQPLESNDASHEADHLTNACLIVVSGRGLVDKISRSAGHLRMKQMWRPKHPMMDGISSPAHFSFRRRH